MNYIKLFYSIFSSIRYLICILILSLKIRFGVPLKSDNLKGKRILLIGSRNRTWIDFSIYYSIIYNFYDVKVTLLLDKSIFLESFKIPNYFNNIFWFLFTRILGSFYYIKLEIINNSILDKKIVTKFENYISEWSTAAVSYDLHIEEFDVKSNIGKFEQSILEFKSSSEIYLSNVYNITLSEKFDLVLCYSGYIGESRILYEYFKSIKLPTIYTEGWPWRPGNLVYNLNKPALEYSVDHLINDNYWSKIKELEYLSYLNLIDNNRITSSSNSNFYRIQKNNINNEIDIRLKMFLNGGGNIALAATNVNGDSSMIRKELSFTSQKDWLSKLLQWFGNNPGYKLLIRIHPGEAWAGDKCVDKLELFFNNQNIPSNVFIIHSYEKINTFQLLTYANLTLTWISNIGAEFIARGTPCIDAGFSKFSCLNITPEFTTQSEYFNLVDKYLKHKSEVSIEKKELAKRYIYFIFNEMSVNGFGKSYDLKSTTKMSKSEIKQHIILAAKFFSNAIG